MGTLVRHVRLGEVMDLMLDGEKVGEIVLQSNRQLAFRDFAPRLRVQHRRKLAASETPAPAVAEDVAP